MPSDSLIILFIAYVCLAPLTAVILAFWALRRGKQLAAEVARLKLRPALPAEVPSQAPSAPAAEVSWETPGAPPVEDGPIVDATAEEAPTAAPTPELESPAAEEAATEDKPIPSHIPPSRAAQTGRQSSPVPAKAGWEQRLAGGWMLWLGGITLALGGVFLVKVSIDMGLIGPGLRCLLGGLLGLVLMLGGELLRRHPAQLALAARAPNYLPAALSAAGVAILFAVIYAAYGLYGFISAFPAFLLLGVTALAAIALALLQGPYIAALGLLGGFVSPLLVSSADPQALPLFSFLLALVGAALTLARYRDWPWLASLALIGANGWGMLYSGAAWRGESAPLFALYILALAGLAVWHRHDLLRGWQRIQSPPRPVRDRWMGLDLLVSFSFLGIFLNAFFMLRLSHYTPLSLITLGLLVTFALVQGRRLPALTALPWMAAATTLAGIAFWYVPQFVPGADPYIVLDGVAIAHPRTPILPPEFNRFAVVSALFGLLFGLGGHALGRGAQRPGAWASLAAGTPLAILILAYWHIEDFAPALPWAAVSIALAGLAMLAAWDTHRRGKEVTGDPRGQDGALGAYAVAVVAGLSLAATMELREAWLTVALSLQLPAIAWIDDKLRLKALRQAAGALAILVIARLLWNQTLLSGSPLGHPLFNWILYGYGLPALAFAGAAWGFRRHGEEWLRSLLEAGALLFTVLLISFEIRGLFNEGEIGRRAYNLAESATQILSWLGLTLAAYWLNRRYKRPVFTWGWRILGGLSLLGIVVGLLVTKNPLWAPIPVGEATIFNLLLLAYLLPALLLALIAWVLKRGNERPYALVAALAAGLLVLVWQALELRHGFQGSRLDTRFYLPDSEWYAYSLLWLADAAVILVIGIRWRLKALRHLGLGFFCLVVLKVFLSDMAALEGLLRALSFLGLGASLIGIGYLYQRLVFPVEKSSDESGKEAKENGQP